MCVNMCNTCDNSITDIKYSVMCSVCHNNYHLNCMCLRLDNIPLTNSFKCYQCTNNELPFINIEDFSLTQSNVLNDIRLHSPNALTFNPSIAAKKNTNAIDNEIDPDTNCHFTYNSSSNFYSVSEFNFKIDSLNLSGNELSLLHLNIRSIRHKLDAFINFLNSLKHTFSIIALTETWLTDSESNNLYSIPGYTAVYQNRKNKVGGGICLFIDQNLTFEYKNDLSVMSENKNIESLFIEIINEKSKNISIL